MDFNVNPERGQTTLTYSFWFLVLPPLPLWTALHNPLTQSPAMQAFYQLIEWSPHSMVPTQGLGTSGQSDLRLWALTLRP